MVSRYNGLQAISSALVDQSFWSFNTMILILPENNGWIDFVDSSPTCYKLRDWMVYFFMLKISQLSNAAKYYIWDTMS
jgi:hypothetical protein